jgi:hypothetical protein
MDDYTGVCVGGPGDGETYWSPFPQFTYWTKVEGVFDHTRYHWDGECWVSDEGGISNPHLI